MGVYQPIVKTRISSYTSDPSGASVMTLIKQIHEVVPCIKRASMSTGPGT